MGKIFSILSLVLIFAAPVYASAATTTQYFFYNGTSTLWYWPDDIEFAHGACVGSGGGGGTITSNGGGGGAGGSFVSAWITRANLSQQERLSVYVSRGGYADQAGAGASSISDLSGTQWASAPGGVGTNSNTGASAPAAGSVQGAGFTLLIGNSGGAGGSGETTGDTSGGGGGAAGPLGNGTAGSNGDGVNGGSGGTGNTVMSGGTGSAASGDVVPFTSIASSTQGNGGGAGGGNGLQGSPGGFFGGGGGGGETGGGYGAEGICWIEYWVDDVVASLATSSIPIGLMNENTFKSIFYATAIAMGSYFALFGYRFFVG